MACRLFFVVLHLGKRDIGDDGRAVGLRQLLQHVDKKHFLGQPALFRVPNGILDPHRGQDGLGNAGIQDVSRLPGRGEHPHVRSGIQAVYKVGQQTLKRLVCHALPQYQNAIVTQIELLPLAQGRFLHRLRNGSSPAGDNLSVFLGRVHNRLSAAPLGAENLHGYHIFPIFPIDPNPLDNGAVLKVDGANQFAARQKKRQEHRRQRRNQLLHSEPPSFAFAGNNL